MFFLCLVENGLTILPFAGSVGSLLSYAATISGLGATISLCDVNGHPETARIDGQLSLSVLYFI